MLPLITSGRSGQDFARVADRLVSIENAQVRSMVSTTLSLWSQSDPDAALGWAVANASRLEASSLTSLAQQLGQSNAALAASTLDRLPPQHHAAWLRGAAAGIGQNDPTAALRFIEPYRGRPEYDQALASVVSRIAQSDPPAAARLLSSMPASPQINAAMANVAGNWAQRDPTAAAQYVLSIQDPVAQSNAAGTVASVWARSDADGAQRWVLSLPSGQTRDGAINTYLTSVASTGTFDTRVLAAYSNDGARQNGASRAIVQLGRSNLQEARRLLETHLTDPAIRRQAEDQLARTGGSGGTSQSVLIDGIILQ
jgi:hypothetical protein